jgi:CBS domain containing-hemolysin-like protein
VASPHRLAHNLHATARSGEARNENQRRVVAETARYFGALSILLVGAVHAQQYYDAYFSVVPIIGSLFLLSFVGAGIVGTVLIAPVRGLGRVAGDVALVAAALGAIGIAVGTFVSLLISEYTPLFGFMESGYRLAIVLTLVFDVMTTVFLGTFVALVAPQLVQTFTTKLTAKRAASS